MLMLTSKTKVKWVRGLNGCPICRGLTNLKVALWYSCFYVVPDVALEHMLLQH
jgi:hypothetical protein